MLAALVLSLTGAVLTGVSGWWVRSGAEGNVYTVDSVPSAPVVLVLGARVYANGEPSAFLAARLELARRLYVSGKARVILVSGDNGQPEYNEVDPMRRWLIERGVPERVIVGDHAGFDTWDSCVRAKRVFGVDKLIVVTQSFHVERSVTLCRRVGIDAVGVGDDTARQFKPQWMFGASRERLANVKALLDGLANPEPTFLGPYETAVDEALANS